MFAPYLNLIFFWPVLCLYFYIYFMGHERENIKKLKWGCSGQDVLCVHSFIRMVYNDLTRGSLHLMIHDPPTTVLSLKCAFM